MGLTNAERARRYIARLKAAAQAPSPSVCPHCGGSLLADAEAAEPESPPKPRPQAPQHDFSTASGTTQKRPKLTDAEVATLAPGRYAIERGLLLWVGRDKRTFQYQRSGTGYKPFYKTVGHWPDMSVEQARAETALLHQKPLRRI
jgi:hypothetical protein